MTSSLVIGSVGEKLLEDEQLLLKKIISEIMGNDEKRKDFGHWVTITHQNGYPYFMMIWSSVDGAMFSGMSGQGEEISETQKKAKKFFEDHVCSQKESDLILFLIDVNEFSSLIKVDKE